MCVFSNGICGICVFLFLSGRMRERGPCICGVGVWSLLLSLCLASLTHAHRSHTGRSMYVFMSFYVCVCVCVCVCVVHNPVTWSVSVCCINGIGSFVDYHCRQPLQPILFLRVVKLEWIGCVPPEGVQWPDSQWNTRPQRLFVEKNIQKSSLLKGRGTRVILQGLLSSGAFTSLQSHQSGATLQNACRLQRRQQAVSLMD